jgi:hypothetical protein
VSRRLYEVQLVARTPLSLTRAHPSAHDHAGATHIAGRPLRGAAAARALQQGMEANGRDFQLLFGPAGVRVGPAYPEGLRPAPLTLKRCKASPAHPLVDTATAEAAFALRPDGPSPFRPCGACGAPMQPLGTYFPPGPPFVLDRRTRVALRRDTGTAARGLLYTREEIPEGSAFAARLEGEPEDVERLGDLLDGAWVGTGLSRGLGGIAVVALKPLAEGIQAAAAVAAARALAEAIGYRGVALRLTLVSPAVFSGPWGTTGAVPDPPRLAEELNLPPELAREASLIDCVTAEEVQFGWQDTWRLPAPPWMAAAAGSVLTLGLPDLSEAQADDAIAALQRGIGLRRTEGYGWADLFDPIHETDPVAEGEGGTEMADGAGRAARWRARVGVYDEMVEEAERLGAQLRGLAPTQLHQLVRITQEDGLSSGAQFAVAQATRLQGGQESAFRTFSAWARGEGERRLSEWSDRLADPDADEEGRARARRDALLAFFQRVRWAHAARTAS